MSELVQGDQAVPVGVYRSEHGPRHPPRRPPGPEADVEVPGVDEVEDGRHHRHRLPGVHHPVTIDVIQLKCPLKVASLVYC